MTKAYGEYIQLKTGLYKSQPNYGGLQRFFEWVHHLELGLQLAQRTYFFQVVKKGYKRDVVT